LKALELVVVSENFEASAHPFAPENGGSRLAIHRVRRQLVGFREQAALTQQDVIDTFDWSMSKVYRIERGPTDIRVSDAMALLAIYGVTDEETKQKIIDPVRAANRPERVPYKDLITDRQRSYYEYEAVAKSIRIFAPDMIPDFMHPSGTQVTHGAEEQLEDMHRRRSEYLLSGRDPDLRIILDETTLHREPQFCDAVNQAAGQASVQVVPWEYGAYPLMKWPYTLLDFPEEEQLSPVLYIGQDPHDVLTMDNPQETEKYRAAFDALAADIPATDATGKILDYVVSQNAWRRENFPIALPS
jgi:transcriptional regulator with XRE-family HTH domain